MYKIRRWTSAVTLYFAKCLHNNYRLIDSYLNKLACISWQFMYTVMQVSLDKSDGMLSVLLDTDEHVLELMLC